jgi:A/G-specific adenine glycosylase
MPRSSTPHPKRATPPPRAPRAHRDAARRLAFRRRLLAWWARAARDLPWRRTRNPYRVLVSEFMLQQTQVNRVEQFYPRFLARFPDLRTLAHAPARAVREAWEGLGYYARARNLHALARTVVRHHAARVPDDPSELIKLPGVGPYTAGAVATFAYEKPVPAVDTNASRVIRRVFFGEKDGGRGRGRGRGSGQRAADIWATARALVPRQGERAWQFNQALMELGALVCTARSPQCPACPVRPVCRTGRRLAPDDGRRRQGDQS